MDVVRAIEKIPTDRNDKPKVDVIVVDCGEVGAADKPSALADPTRQRFRDTVDEMMGDTEKGPTAAQAAKGVLAGSRSLPGSLDPVPSEEAGTAVAATAA